jgi:hypothetical protein
VKDDYYKHTFEVKIGKEESVAALKKAIKEEKSQAFREVDADPLVLWNENIPLDEHLKETVEKLGLVDENLYSLILECRRFFLNNQKMDTSTSSSRICLSVSSNFYCFSVFAEFDTKVDFFTRLLSKHWHQKHIHVAIQRCPLGVHESMLQLRNNVSFVADFSWPTIRTG